MDTTVLSNNKNTDTTADEWMHGIGEFSLHDQ